MTVMPLIVWLTVILFVGIYCPVIAFYAYKMHTNGKQIVMSKREPRLTISLSLLSILLILFLTVTMTVYFFDNKYNDILNNICNLFVITIYVCYIWIVLWRLWCIYFEIIHSISVLKVSWQQFIQTNAGENNWYLNGATETWANPSYLKRIMLLIIITHIILYATIWVTIYLIQTNTNINNLQIVFKVIDNLQIVLRIILIVAPWICIFKIYRKIPAFHDDIGISEEIKHVIICYSLIGIFFIALIIVISLHLIYGTLGHNFMIDILFLMTMHLIVAIIFITAMRMTWYPLKQYIINTTDYVPFDTDASLHLQHILCSMFATDLLMDGLKRQYSQENLLFIIEISLYQRAVFEHLNFNKFQPHYVSQNIDLNALYERLQTLPTTCPKSSIVEGNYDDIIEKYGRLLSSQILSFVQREHLRFKHIAYLLYQKYVITESQFAVNISWKVRNKIIGKCHEYDKWMTNKSLVDIVKLFDLFQDAKDEVERLINGDSIFRLKTQHSIQYQKIQNVFTQGKLSDIDENSAYVMFIKKK
eukprot:223562_1